MARPWLVILCCLAGMSQFQAWLVLPALGWGGGTMGADYGLFLPDLLAGYYWFHENGLLALPWFTPAFCGGFPFYPDANVAWFSLPQFLTFVLGPLRAVWITAVAMPVVGFLGTYGWMRGSFGVSRAAAVLAGALFMFNGFNAARMEAGHLTFHAFMLVPAVAACLMPPARARLGPWRAVARLCLAGVGFSLMFEAGMVHAIPPAVLAMLVAMLMQIWWESARRESAGRESAGRESAGRESAGRERMGRGGARARPLLLLAGAGAVALALSAVKLVALLSLLGQLPRDEYPLPGVPALRALQELVFQAVFFFPPRQASQLLVNSRWLLLPHEWEYGVSPVALLLILGGAGCAAWRAWRRRERPGRASSWGRLGIMLAILALLSLPLLFNWYAPGWNAWLKSLPYFANSTNALRWLSAYTVVAVVAAGLGAEAMARQLAPAGSILAGPMLAGPVLAGAAILALLGWQLLIDRSAYPEFRDYAPEAVDAAYWRARAGGVPVVSAIVAPMDAQGRAVPVVDRNDALTQGYSQLMCYQPLLGYGLEAFPLGAMRPGPALVARNGALNVKNPACYLFPAANACKPGDPFKVSQRAAAARFLAYRGFHFAMPWYVGVARWTSALVWALVAMGLAGGAWHWRISSGPARRG